MLTSSDFSSSPRVTAPSSREESSSSEESLPFPLLELPGEVIGLVGLKIRNPLDAVGLMSTCKGLCEEPDLAMRIPELIEARIIRLGNSGETFSFKCH